jgi:formylglycine-generating enzyme required for sulfatase activity
MRKPTVSPTSALLAPLPTQSSRFAIDPLDMTSADWVALSTSEQCSLSREYQRITANALGLPTEQTIVVEKVAFEFALVPAGRYLAGARPGEQGARECERPMHIRVIDCPFWLGKFPVTQMQWTSIVGAAPWSRDEYAISCGDCPATCISWLDVMFNFVPKLGSSFSLPTEAEWEYACRAGTTSRFFWGDDPAYSEMEQYAWYEANCWAQDERYAHPVGRKLPNPWGLHDMSGNVLEWCSTQHYPYGIGEPSADGNSVNALKVVRGGYWSFLAERCRSAYRCSCRPDLRDCLLGVRLKLDCMS